MQDAMFFFTISLNNVLLNLCCSQSGYIATTVTPMNKKSSDTKNVRDLLKKTLYWTFIIGGWMGQMLLNLRIKMLNSLLYLRHKFMFFSVSIANTVKVCRVCWQTF